MQASKKAIRLAELFLLLLFAEAPLFLFASNISSDEWQKAIPGVAMGGVLMIYRAWAANGHVDESNEP
jgi:hypothetical protein